MPLECEHCGAAAAKIRNLAGERLAICRKCYYQIIQGARR